MLETLLVAGIISTTQPKPAFTFTKPTSVSQPKPKLSLKEKIKTNYYKCNEDVEWISAENAHCLPKAPVEPVTEPQNVSEDTSGNLYDYHSCTWHAKSMRPDLPNNLGNAYSWVANAQAQGIPTGSKPRAGAIGQQGGHVVYIISVKGNQVYLSERNWDWQGSYQERWAPASDFYYIY